ncbi:unnamed protein product [Amoebophrya sp. A25]|nr:unnamed protein product [Amoebophrya sp. A25]|eukprot:GSA25T00018826001.1
MLCIISGGFLLFAKLKVSRVISARSHGSLIEMCHDELASAFCVSTNALKVRDHRIFKLLLCNVEAVCYDFSIVQCSWFVIINGLYQGNLCDEDIVLGYDFLS